MQINLFNFTSIEEKIKAFDSSANQLLLNPQGFIISPSPLRDVKVVLPEELPKKIGLSTASGQGRLLHDLASIELQAFELCVRTLIEFPDAPKQFREQLLKIAFEESEHLKLCISAISQTGHHWGEWPVHLALWNAVSSEDSLLDRILIVHRYLEGSGLDAGETILRRLGGVTQGEIFKTVKKIVDEEIAHVQFGNYWYHAICQLNYLISADDFKTRMLKLSSQIPRRAEPISEKLRIKAGFNENEIEFLVQFQKNKVPQQSKEIH